MNSRQLDFLEPKKNDGEPPLWNEFPERNRAQVVDRLAFLMAKMVATRFQALQTQKKREEKQDE